MVLPAQHLLCRAGVLKRGNSMTDQELAKIANEVRRGIVTGVHAAKSGHPGGSLGAADIMTYLYFEEMDVDPANPSRAERDRFVLSRDIALRHSMPCSPSAGSFPGRSSRRSVISAAACRAIPI